MVEASDASTPSSTPWYEDERWLREPTFVDVPFEQSGWKPILEVLERVNLAKARLLISIYEAQVRVAYQRYCAIRDEEEAQFRAERPEAERHNDALREQIRTVEQAMAQVRDRWQPELNALRKQLYSAWLDAHIKAVRAGIDPPDDPPMCDSVPPDKEKQAQSSHSEKTSAPQSTDGVTPTGQNPPAMPSTPVQSPPSLTIDEVIVEQNLPDYQGMLIPKPLWAILVVVVGLGLGLILSLTAGLIAPGQPMGEPLPIVLVLLAGIVLTYLWTRALWGATAVVAELYHLFGWHEGKARRTAWSIGAGLGLLILTTGLCWWLLMDTARTSTSLSGWVPIALVLTTLMMLLLLACAMLEGFLEGRYKPIGHRVAARIAQHEREQSRRAGKTEDTDPVTGGTTGRSSSGTDELSSASEEVPAPSEAEQAARVAIRHYQALWRQYNHLKSEMEQELAPYREQIEQLKAEMRPLYPTLPPHSRTRIMLAYRQWRQMYLSYLQHLANALRECQGGDQLAPIVRELIQEISSQ